MKMTRKPGHNYEANIEIAFEDASQAENFCRSKTPASGRIEVDLEDPEVLEMFEANDQLISEIDYPDAADPDVQAELKAALEVGAEITIKLRWVKNV